MTLLADARDRARAAGRALHEASRSERRLLVEFARRHGGDELETLREAIRTSAFAERDAEHAALLVVALERLT